MRNEFIFDADLKRKKLIAEPTVTQHDALRFVVRIFDNNAPYAIPDGTTLRLVGQRNDKKSYYVDGVLTGENEVAFDLAKEHVSVVGKVHVAIQIVTDGNRVSSLPFTFEVIKDLATDYIPAPDEKTLIELVVQDGPGIIEEAKQVAQDNKTQFLNAVDSVASRDTTYPTPQHGDTVRVTSEAKTYRYVSGNGWVVTDAYNPTAVDEITAQLAQRATKIELQAVASGSPKGAYASLTELQSAFPTGDTGIYIVSADGNWYYWNGSAWTVGGQYLTTQFVSALTTQNEPWEVI